MRVIILVFLFAQFLALAQEDVLRPKGKPIDAYQSSQTTTNKMNWSVGFEFGGNYNMFYQDLTWNPPLENIIFNVASEGNGISHYFGLFLDFNVTEKIGFHAKVQYNTVYYSTSENDFLTALVYHVFTGITSVQTIPAEYYFENSMEFFNIEPSLKINITPKFFALIGFSYQLALSDVKREESLTSLDANYYFINEFGDFDGYTLESSDEYALDDRFGLNLTLGYRFDINPNIYIAPQLHYQHFFDDIAFNHNAFENNVSLADPVSGIGVNHIRLSIALGFNMGGTK